MSDSDSDSFGDKQDIPLISSDEHEDRQTKLSKADQTYTNARDKLVVACAICGAFMILEFVGGYLASSLAIMADAVHLLSDLASFAISLIAMSFGRIPAKGRLTFGYARAEVVGALISIGMIWILTIGLLYEAFHRVRHPEEVDGRLMFIVATLGLIVNILMMMVLGHSHGHGGHGGHGHSHSHGGSHGHSDAEAEAIELEDHGHSHSHSRSEKKSHSHSHGEKKKENKHAHSHSHSHSDSHGHSHSHGGSGYSDDDRHDHHHDDHDDQDGHGHSHSHSHSHGNAPCHGHGHGDSQGEIRQVELRKNASYDPELGSCDSDSDDENIFLKDTGASSNQKGILKKTASIEKKSVRFADDKGHGHSHGGRACSGDHGHGAGADSMFDRVMTFMLGKSFENVNVRAAYIHVIGDLAQSAGVMVAALVIWAYPAAVLADPICTFVFSGIVMFTTYHLTLEIGAVLLESAPAHIDVGKVQRDILATPGVVAMHEFHLWSITTNTCSLTAHLQVIGDRQDVVTRVRDMLASTYEIKHVTLQTECPHTGTCSDPSIRCLVSLGPMRNTPRQPANAAYLHTLTDDLDV